MGESAEMVHGSEEFRVSSHWKLFLGLSRTPHGVLDLATPALAALLWLGAVPPLSVVVVGLITAFAGYTAVYALNDLVDYRVDKERLALRVEPQEHLRVDDVMVRHPLAVGRLPFLWGLSWCAFWAVVALAGAYWLNPFCALLFVLTAGLEALYCKLLRVTHLKIIPSAIVKSMGGLAGVYAVDSNPALGYVALLFLWLAAWEVGCQNIANDIVDMPDDSKVQAKTTSTVKGLQESVFRLLAAASMASIAGVAVYWKAGQGIGWLYPVGAGVLGWYLLLGPARNVYYDPGPKAAAQLFNRASYMPASFLLLTMISIYVPRLVGVGG